ncbi:Cell surface antigen-like protein Sca7 [Rickettsia akari str. Hartford]|uniref:Cell surface antigen-like protein Sca7 n=1 Tax=Rickettsia akari (strain Hartford) TaxID=293614 RepID=A8GMW1_RICAH|nr:Cell surface antigen-like protein Sca7 [Rickettsia akari str. Hartford]
MIQQNVSLANDVFVGGVNFTNGGKLQLSKSLSAKNVDFGAKCGTLEFNGNDRYIVQCYYSKRANLYIKRFQYLNG